MQQSRHHYGYADGGGVGLAVYCCCFCSCRRRAQTGVSPEPPPPTITTTKNREQHASSKIHLMPCWRDTMVRCRWCRAGLHNAQPSLPSPHPNPQPTRQPPNTLHPPTTAHSPRAASAVERLYATAAGGYGEEQQMHDHIAFRTFGVPGLGIAGLGAELQQFGFVEQPEECRFDDRRIVAKW